MSFSDINSADTSTLPNEWPGFLPPELHNDLGINSLKTKKNKVDISNKSGDNQKKISIEHDLTMEFLTKEQKRNKIRNLSIEGYEIVDDHVVYRIEIHIQECSWIVFRRYREFYHLHEKLVQLCGIAWELLPPKKIVGNLKPANIEKRKILLERYLKNVIHILVHLPRVLVEFLEIDQFDVHTVCRNLASDLYEIGDELLAKRLIFKITPLQIHCINRRLQLPLPTCEGDNAGEDIGHLYSFIQQVRRVLVYPGDESHMFLGNNDLNYDLSIFKSLRYLELQKCDTELLEGIETIQKIVKHIRAHKSLQLLKDFLIGNESWTQGVLTTVSAGKESHNDVISQFQKWNKVKQASFSYNDLRSLDYSVTLLPNVEILDLSHNLLTEVQYLEELTFLTDLNLSYNEIRYLAEFPYRIPSVAKLHLAGNGIQNIVGLEKMYALQDLDISNNKLDKVSDVLLLAQLPMLTLLYVRGNRLCEETHYRERIFVQFDHRAEEIKLDGLNASKKEMNRVAKMKNSIENFDIIPDDFFPVPAVQSESNTSKVERYLTSIQTPPVVTAISPKIKKKDRIAKIDVTAAPTPDLEESRNAEEDESFRERIEKLRVDAGQSWLTYYNEMQDEKPPERSPEIKKDGRKTKQKENKDTEKTPDIQRKHQSNNAKEEASKDVTEKPLPQYISTGEIDLELSDELRFQVKSIINDNIDLSLETFLISIKNTSEDAKEYMVAVDSDLNLLTEIDFETGSTVAQYQLETVRGLTIYEEPKSYTLQFEAKKYCKDDHTDNYLLVKLKTHTTKDAAGLYVLLKSYNEKSRARNRSQNFTSMDATKGLLDNPFKIPNEMLMGFFQEFLRKLNLQKKSSSRSRSVQPSAATNYENIDIGLSLLSHELSDTTTQDIVSILWVGCLPYLFPDEEIPVCIVMTTVNIFLFRIFIPEHSTEHNKDFGSKSAIQEAMHCFYSFPLKALREIVVGLFDQGLRIEVGEEGPRGTFVFLTRDANKTGQFLDSLSAILGFQNEKELVKMRNMLATDPAQRETMASLPTIVYPDESKINSLKMQLKEQGLLPLDNRENLISYSIVYERNDEDASNIYDGPYSPSRLRSLILTNARLILCDEDYVHWPLPSFVRSAPFTPQWIVDNEEYVENIIAVDVWSDRSELEGFLDCHGVSITYENKSADSNEIKVDINDVWNLSFHSPAEREQFVRSVACLWKNNFDQELNITHSKPVFSKSTLRIKGHEKKLSGNMSVPGTQVLDNPEMFLKIDRSRLNELFREKIAQDDDVDTSCVQFVTFVGCKPYQCPDVEFDVSLILGNHNIYMLCEARNRDYILANIPFETDSDINSLYIKTIKIRSLRQVVVGLFDQCFRLETEFPEQTFLFVTRNFDRTNDFIQRLSQVILALPKQPDNIDGNVGRVRSHTGEIFELYKSDDENDPNYYPKSEFIHPNSDTKFVYPSDDLLEKLRYKIVDYIKVTELFPPPKDIGVLLYALIDQSVGGLSVPCTIVVSEKLICLINEDHVNYPLPLFVHELPEKPQYEVVAMQQIDSLRRIEFGEFHSSAFSLVFSKLACHPLSYDARFQISSVEDDTCLVTDVNLQIEKNEEIIAWHLRAHSYEEREKIFNILSKMWSTFYSGKTLPILRKKERKASEVESSRKVDAIE